MSERDQNDLQRLMLLAKNGDRHAYGVVYEEFFTPVFRYIYRRLGDQQTSEDLAQTVFLKVFQSIARFSDKGVSPLAYFFTVARHTLIDYLKKKKEVILDTSEREIEVESDPLDHPRTRAGLADKRSAVSEALLVLPEDQRDAITLRFLDGFSNTEVARIMNRTEDSVRQLQSRGIRHLRGRTDLLIHFDPS